MSGPSLQDKLAAAQQDVEKWSQIAADPNLSPEAARVAQKAAVTVTVKSRARATRRWAGWSQRRCATASPQAKQTAIKRAGAVKMRRVESFERRAFAGEDVTVLCGMAGEVAIAGARLRSAQSNDRWVTDSM